MTKRKSILGCAMHRECRVLILLFKRNSALEFVVKFQKIIFVVTEKEVDGQFFGLRTLGLQCSHTHPIGQLSRQ